MTSPWHFSFVTVSCSYWSIHVDIFIFFIINRVCIQEKKNGTLFFPRLLLNFRIFAFTTDKVHLFCTWYLLGCHHIASPNGSIDRVVEVVPRCILLCVTPNTKIVPHLTPKLCLPCLMFSMKRIMLQLVDPYQYNGWGCGLAFQHLCETENVKRLHDENPSFKQGALYLYCTLCSPLVIFDHWMEITPDLNIIWIRDISNLKMYVLLDGWYMLTWAVKISK